MLPAKLLHGHKVSKPEGVDQQWGQTKDMSDVTVPSGDADSGCQDTDPDSRSTGQVSPSWGGGCVGLQSLLPLKV